MVLFHILFRQITSSCPITSTVQPTLFSLSDSYNFFCFFTICSLQSMLKLLIPLYYREWLSIRNWFGWETQHMDIYRVISSKSGRLNLKWCQLMANIRSEHAQWTIYFHHATDHKITMIIVSIVNNINNQILQLNDNYFSFSSHRWIVIFEWSHFFGKLEDTLFQR